MRIVSGRFRGRALVSPDNREIRPTSDRVRESLFSILESSYSGYLKNTTMLDLFAGTGAVGLEAISRGVDYTVFVENSQQGIKTIRKNIDMLGVDSQTGIIRADATQLGKLGGRHPFKLVFADPPYGQMLADKSLDRLVRGSLLSPDALIIIEESINSPVPQFANFSLLDERKFGDTKIWFAMFVGNHN